MIEGDQSDWSLSSVEVEPHIKQVDEDENSFSVTTLHEQYSYESKHPPKNKPIIFPQQTLNPIGKVVSIVEDFVVVEAENDRVIDLESYLLNKDRGVVGYVVDVLGPVGHHFYAIKQEENNIEVGDRLYFAEGCRVLEQKDIEKLKELGAVKDEDSGEEDQQEQKFPTGAFKRNREQSIECPNPRRMQQPPFNPNFQSNSQWVNVPRNMQGMGANYGQYNPQYNPNLNLMYGYPSTPNMTMGMNMNMGTGLAPLSPEQMLMMSEYYKNCYNQMLNQKK